MRVGHFKWICIGLFLILILSLTSCLEVKQSININKDGSGDARQEFAIQSDVFSMPGAQQKLSELKGELQKEGWNVEPDKDKDGKHFITATKKFKNISELNDDHMRYFFSSERKGFMKKSYALEIQQLKNSDMPFPYEVTLNMPGRIEETSGNKISSDTVKWNLQGFRRGTKLSIKSSAFALPDFASLKESFDKAFNSVFFKEVIVFLRDNNLWVMDGNGKNVKQLTQEGVGKFRSFSVSKDGEKIAYIDRDMSFGNIYTISLGDDTSKKLTDTGDCAFPVISPNGTEIAFVKSDEKYDSAEAQQKVMFEGANPEYMKEGGAKKTGIYVLDIKTGQQRKIVGELQYQLLPKYLGNLTEWHDYGLSWSPDGQKLHFQRNYSSGGEVTDSYLVAIADSHVEHLGMYGAMDSFATDKILYEGEGQLSLYDIATKKTYTLGDGWNGDIPTDGTKLIYVAENRKRVGDKWVFTTNLLLRNMRSGAVKPLVTSDSDKFWEPTLSLDGNKIAFTREEQGSQSSLWSIRVDGADLKKIADNALMPKWTSSPRITFISPSLAKTIVLVAIALMGLLLLFGIALITRKAVKAVAPVPKPKGVASSNGTFCTHCGTENPASASFCKKCGNKLL